MKSPPEILYDGWLLPDAGYGIAQYADRLLQLLMKSPLRDRIRVVTLPGVGASLGVPTLELKSLPRWPKLFREVAWYARLSKFVRGRRPGSLLILPSPGMMLRYPPKTVVTCHDQIYRSFPRYLGRWGYRKILYDWRDRSLAEASHLVAVSQHTGGELRSFLKKRTPPLTVIPHWAPEEFRKDIPETERETIRQKYGLPPRYWLYVGGYDYRKNVGVLIEAYAQVRRAGPCPALVLAGKTPHRKRPVECDISGDLTRTGLGSPEVVLPGFIENRDMPGLYAGAELLVYPSLAEGFGLPPLEAMACGCPAVVADQTSLPEVVTDSEYRFTVNGRDGLAGILSQARDRALPLNPGFDRDDFSEERAMREYGAAVKDLIGEA